MQFEGFGLAEAEYWSAPLRTQSEWSRRLSKEDFEGLLLDAPAQLDPSRHATLPLVVGWGSSLVAAAQAPFDGHALVAAVDLRRNRLRVAAAIELERWVAPAGNPNARIPRGHMVSFQLLEARERVQLPWEAGEWSVRVILRDQVSNPRRVEFDGDPVEVDPTALSVEPPAATPLPDYRSRPDSPEAPAEGIALAVERVTPLREGAQLILRGAFRLPALPHEQVEAGGEDSTPQAVIAVSLVLPSSAGARAGVYRLQVPCYETPDDAGRYAGWFALDILPWLARGSHTVFVYAVSGEQWAGPQPAALIAAADMPEGS